MAGTNAQGSRVEHSSGSPSVWNVIEHVTNISGPSGTANLIDVTDLLSTGKEYLPGLADFGEVTLQCNFTGGTEQMALFQLFSDNADADEYRLRIPVDATKVTFHLFRFNAIVSAWAITEAVDAKVGLNITLRTTGGVEYVGIA